jgi:hypothetical protein
MAKQLIVDGVHISMTTLNKEDYICITDMVNAKDDESRAADVIKNWLRTRSTIEFLGTWETLYNPNFKVVEFDHFRTQAGLPSFVLSVNNWVQATNAVGILSKAGRYGGTYAHRDIALEFGAAISPIFKLYLIKEYQRLKEVESHTLNLEWDVRRIMTKVNYALHTDAVQKFVIPKSIKPIDKQHFEFAEEADILNMALYGYTAKQWREANPDLAANNKNMRDFSSITDLLIMSNLETMSAQLIQTNLTKQQRYAYLKKMADEQRVQFDKIDIVKSIKKSQPDTYLNAENLTPDEIEAESKKDILEANRRNLSQFNQKLVKAANFNPHSENDNK